jgi:hypothetical protein
MQEAIREIFLRESTEKKNKTREFTSVTGRLLIPPQRRLPFDCSRVAGCASLCNLTTPSVGTNKCTEQQKPNHVHRKETQTAQRDAGCPNDSAATLLT